MQDVKLSRREREKLRQRQDMLAAALEAVEGADVFIAAAAVADYRPQHNADKKIKKTADDITIALTKLVSPKQVESLPLMSKVSLAKCLIEYISTHLIA